MDIIKIEQEALVLDEAEKEKLLELLKYARHRGSVHCKPFLDVKFIEYMIERLEDE